MAHAVWSPSSAARWLCCPPSARLAQGLPERTNAAAEEGSIVHAVIERALKTGTLPMPRAPWVKSDRMSDREVVERVMAFIKSLGAGELQIEQRVVLDKGCWGQLDVAHIAEDVITVFDYKNGGWDVEVEDNKQLLTYAATFLDEHPEMPFFRLVIFQPNSWTAAGEDQGFKQIAYARRVVVEHREAVRTAMAYAGPPIPGPHCRWCPAFQKCPVMAQDANFLMAAISRDLSTLTSPEVTRMLRVIRAVSDMKEALEKELLKRVYENGEIVDGVRIENKRKWRIWNNERDAAQKLYELHGAAGVKPVGPAQAEKLSPTAAAYTAVASRTPEGEMTVRY